MPAALGDLWAGALIFAGSEVAATHGGYAEGALEAAEAAALRISTEVKAYLL
jgi:monoamine oxidase